MSRLRIVVPSLLIVILSLAFAIPVFSTDYHVGAEVGDYVTYGNFVGYGLAQAYSEYAWVKNEVTSVSGNDVTLLSTGLLKDGKSVPENNHSYVWNVATGQKNGSDSLVTPIIASNLNQGDLIPPGVYVVNRTENRVFLGVTRTVNINEILSMETSYSESKTFVYDKITGLLLEAVEQLNGVSIDPRGFAFTIIDTNIFTPLSPPSSTSIITPPPTPIATPTPMQTTGVSTTPSPTTQPNQGISIPLEYAVAAVGLVIVVAAALVLKNRKK